VAIIPINKLEYYCGGNTPLPLHKLKKIIRKLDFDEPALSSITDDFVKRSRSRLATPEE
jgi:hypothetical protein